MNLHSPLYLKLLQTLIYLLVFSCSICFFSDKINAQENSSNLPKSITETEKMEMEYYLQNLQINGFVDPPNSPVRTPAEWEEADAIVITWTQFPNILRQIVQHAKEEVEVIIVCDNPNSVVNYLQSGGVDTINVTLLQEEYNSIWIRDYGQWSVYTNEIDSLLLVDWIYNRPRPKDDNVPDAISEHFDLPLYQTIEAPNNMVHTGGNFMTDGLGTGFSSNLILNENDGNGPYNGSVSYPNHTEEEIDQIMLNFMGISRFIKMPTLPYDGINHIDMHMKLLDEETILVSEYPDGVADDPQIEENIEYIQDNFLSPFGTPYDIVRVPAPPDFFGNYPDNNGDYRTFTNSIFINKTVLVPVYNSDYQEDALELYRQLLPGYKVVGINCNDIIPSSGALHCITKLVHTDDPLLIVHQKLKDNYDSTTLSYNVDAYIRHRSDIETSELYYRTHSDSTFVALQMDYLSDNNWSAAIPQQLDSTRIEYYISANSNSGKNSVRPITAPDGFYSFTVYNGLSEFPQDTTDTTNPMDTMVQDTSQTPIDTNVVGIQTLTNQDTNPNASYNFIKELYPNPVSDKLFINIESLVAFDGKLEMVDTQGKNAKKIFEGKINEGKSEFFINTTNFASGIYFIQLHYEQGSEIKKVVVR